MKSEPNYLDVATLGPSSSEMVMLSKDGIVSIDWERVEAASRRNAPADGLTIWAIACTLIAVRDGTWRPIPRLAEAAR